MENIQKRPIFILGKLIVFPKIGKVKYLDLDPQLYNIGHLNATKGAVFNTKHLCDALKRYLKPVERTLG